jgi:hypothetical protein
LALLALQLANHLGDARPQAAAWLVGKQLPDGGWPPCATVPKSTWVSSPTLIALAGETKSGTRASSTDPLCASLSKGVEWLSRHVYPELPAFEGFVLGTLGISPSQAPGSSPWFPGTAGWVIPTAFSILALSCCASRLPDADLIKTICRAQTYLLSRRCHDGGWNHGGSLQRSEDSPSYPETTGLALLALANTTSPALDHALLLAETYLSKPLSPEGSSWLLMGLAAHGRNATPPLLPVRPKTNRDIALQLIAFYALRGRNPFLQLAR